MEDRRVILILQEDMRLQELQEIAELLLQIVPQEHILLVQEVQERLTQEILLLVLVELEVPATLNPRDQELILGLLIQDQEDIITVVLLLVEMGHTPIQEVEAEDQVLVRDIQMVLQEVLVEVQVLIPQEVEVLQDQVEAIDQVEVVTDLLEVTDLLGAGLLGDLQVAATDHQVVVDQVEAISLQGAEVLLGHQVAAIDHQEVEGHLHHQEGPLQVEGLLEVVAEVEDQVETSQY